MKAEIGNKVIAETKKGKRQGTVIKTRVNRDSKKPQYKLTIDFDGKGVEVDYNFWFYEDQIEVVVPEEKGKVTAAVDFIKGIFKKNK